MQKHKILNKRIKTISAVCGILGCGFLLQSQRKTRSRTNQNIENKNRTALITSGPKFVLQGSQDQYHNQLFEQQEYEQLLEDIKGSDNKTYYNRGVILLAQSIQQAKQTGAIELIEAKNMSQKAVQSFDYALKTSIKNDEKEIIVHNQKITQNIADIIETKSCYANHETIIDTLNQLSQKSQEMQNILAIEKESILRNKNNLNRIKPNCYEKVLNLNQQAQKDTTLLKKLFESYVRVQQESYKKELSNPMLCKQTNTDEVIYSLPASIESLNEHQTAHLSTILALDNNKEDFLQILCTQENGDNQHNQELGQSIDNLLEQLKSQIQGENEKKSTNNQEKNYKNLPTLSPEIKQKILENNKERIQKIELIKSENYIPQEYIDELFQEFIPKLDP